MKKMVKILPLLIVTIISVIPVYFVVMMSTHSTAEIFKGNIMIPGKHLLENLKTIIEGGFGLYYWNSFYTSVLSAVLCVVISSMAGFALTKYNFRLRKKITNLILVIMMIPSQISLIGYIVEMKNLGLSNTHLPLIIVWGANAFGVFFMVQYMQKSVPNEVIESARIDGCGEFRIFFQIVLPFIKPALGTLFMLVFLWSWNNYILQLTLINDRKLFTIPLGIQALRNAYTQDWGARGAGLAASVLPMLLIFAAGSKTFIKGLTAGAVKG